MTTPNTSTNQKQNQPNVLRISIDSQASSASMDSQSPDGIPKAVKEKGYKLAEKLGSGAFSTVFKAYSEKQPGVTLACKRFDLTDATQEVWREKCLKSEMKIMLRLRHPNIIRAYDAIKTRKMAFIFMAFAENGSVGEYLEKTEKPIEEKLAKNWFQQILSAVSHLHMKGVAHRDIKPDNFLLDKNYKEALLSDFGFSCMNADTDRLMKGTNCGTDLYKGPELLKLTEGHVYDAKKSDIFAMGVSLFEMLNLNKPFGDSVDNSDKNSLSVYIQRQKSKKYRFNKNVKLSQNAIKCLDQFLEPEPERRTASQFLLKHKWFTG